MRSIASRRKALLEGMKSRICDKGCYYSHSTDVFLCKKMRLDLFNVTYSWQVCVGYLLSCHFDYLSRYVCRVEIQAVVSVFVFKDYSFFFPFSSFSALHLLLMKTQNDC